MIPSEPGSAKVLAGRLLQVASEPAEGRALMHALMGAWVGFIEDTGRADLSASFRSAVFAALSEALPQNERARVQLGFHHTEHHLLQMLQNQRARPVEELHLSADGFRPHAVGPPFGARFIDGSPILTDLTRLDVDLDRLAPLVWRALETGTYHGTDSFQELLTAHLKASNLRSPTVEELMSFERNCLLPVIGARIQRMAELDAIGGPADCIYLHAPAETAARLRTPPELKEGQHFDPILELSLLPVPRGTALPLPQHPTLEPFPAELSALSKTIAFTRGVWISVAIQQIEDALAAPPHDIFSSAVHQCEGNLRRSAEALVHPQAQRYYKDCPPYSTADFLLTGLATDLGTILDAAYVLEQAGVYGNAKQLLAAATKALMVRAHARMEDHYRALDDIGASTYGVVPTGLFSTASEGSAIRLHTPSVAPAHHPGAFRNGGTGCPMTATLQPLASLGMTLEESRGNVVVNFFKWFAALYEDTCQRTAVP